MIDSEYQFQEPRIQQNLARLRESKCSKHFDIKAIEICTNKSCLDKNICFLCQSCSIIHSPEHRTHGHVYLLDQLFSTHLLKSIVDITQEKRIKSNVTDSLSVVKDIESIFNQIQYHLIKIIQQECNIVKKKIIKSLGYSTESFQVLIDNYIDTLKKYLIYDYIPPLENFLDNYIEHNRKLNNFILTHIEYNQKINIKEILKQVAQQASTLATEFRKVISNQFKIDTNIDNITALSQNFMTISTPSIKLTPNIKIKSNSNWVLDSLNKSHLVALSNYNTHATKIGSSGFAVVCGSEAFESGIHIWEVTVHGLTKENGDFVQFGLLDKVENPSVYSTFEWKKTWSITSQILDGKPTVSRMNTVGKPIDFNFNTFKCIYNANDGLFTIESREFKAEAPGLKWKKLYPFFDLYHPGNEIRLNVIY